MGRIKTTLIRRTGNELFARYSDRFKSDFEENKLIVAELADIPSKKLRNVIAGYITKLVKQQKSRKITVS